MTDSPPLKLCRTGEVDGRITGTLHTVHGEFPVDMDAADWQRFAQAIEAAPSGGGVAPTVRVVNGDLALACTDDTETGVVGVLTTPDGVFRMTCTREGWVGLVRDVAAGRNPLLLATHLAWEVS